MTREKGKTIRGVSEIKAKPTIVGGYPSTEYKFTGRWSRQEKGTSGGRTAKRNRPIIDIPVYENAKGETVIDMTQAVLVKKYKKEMGGGV